MAGKRTFAQRTLAAWTFNSGCWTGVGTGVIIEEQPDATWTPGRRARTWTPQATKSRTMTVEVGLRPPRME
jgi:hypothetical protein